MLDGAAFRFSGSIDPNGGEAAVHQLGASDEGELSDEDDVRSGRRRINECRAAFRVRPEAFDGHRAQTLEDWLAGMDEYGFV
jgi:hypothetical protein